MALSAVAKDMSMHMNTAAAFPQSLSQARKFPNVGNILFTKHVRPSITQTAQTAQMPKSKEMIQSTLGVQKLYL